MADKNAPHQPGEDGAQSGTGHAHDARFDALSGKLDALRAEHAKSEDKPAASAGDAAGLGQAMRLSSEFAAGIIAGAGVGWVIDRFAGTSPWGLIVCFLLGFAAGIMNVLRAAGMMGSPLAGPKNNG